MPFENQTYCIVAEFVKMPVDESAKLSNLFENSLQKFDEFLVSNFTGQIGKRIENVGAKIENLLSSQFGLPEEVDS